REAKIPLDRRQRDVHDRDVEDDHHESRAEHVERGPARAFGSCHGGHFEVSLLFYCHCFVGAAVAFSTRPPKFSWITLCWFATTQGCAAGAGSPAAHRAAWSRS